MIHGCRKFERRVHDLLDARAALREDVSLRQHAAQCSACRNRLVWYIALSDDMTSKVGKLPHPNHRRQFDDLLESAEVNPFATASLEPPLPRRASLKTKFRAAVGLAVVVAAALILCAPAATNWRYGPGTTPPNPGTQLESASARPTAASGWRRGALAVSPDLRERERWPIQEMIRSPELAAIIDRSGRLWQSATWRPVAGSLSPVANSVASTYSVLRNTWPIGHVAKPTG